MVVKDGFLSFSVSKTCDDPFPSRHSQIHRNIITDLDFDLEKISPSLSPFRADAVPPDLQLYLFLPPLSFHALSV